MATKEMLFRDLRVVQKLAERDLEHAQKRQDHALEALPKKLNLQNVAPWPLLAILEETTINQAMGDYQKDVITIREDAKLSEALSLLAKERMLSLPVQAKDSIDVVGFVDVLDVLAHIVRLCSEGKSIPEADEAFENAILMYQKGFNFASTPVKAIIDSSKLDPLVTVYGTGTLAQVIDEAFSRGIHRVAVFNRHHEVLTNIMSQSVEDIVRFIMQKIHDSGSAAAVLGPLMGKTVDDICLGSRPVISMSDELPAFKALQLIVKHKISAVAIVDKLGQLTADFSATEVRGLSVENFPSLRKPVLTFLEQSRSRIGRPDDYPFSTPIICTGDTTIETVLLKLHMHGLHRLWIVNEFARPIGIISLTDIMRLLLPPSQEEYVGLPTLT